jgi:predicted dehydrogenase
MHHFTRRSFLKASTAAGTAFTIVKPELVRGAGKEKLKFGLVGCGGRGTAAIDNALEGNDNLELVALADVFEDHLEACLRTSKEGKYADRVKVDPEHRFVGFDAYKKLLASDIDIVFLCTPPGYRPLHFEAAVEARKHIFTEKPFGTDPVNVRRFMAAARKSEELKLTVKSGAQRRSQIEYKEMLERVRNGGIGDIAAAYVSWEVASPVILQKARDPKWGDMEWQHRAWYSFLWICGDMIVEQHVHSLDSGNMLMGAHPVECVSSGGRAWKTGDEIYGNIYDHFCTDYIYPNGAHATSRCRQYPKGTAAAVKETVAGTKGSVSFVPYGSDNHVIWTMHNGEKTVVGAKGLAPYVQEHVDMMNSILGSGPYINEGMAVAESTMTAIMGRESAYSGQKITWDMIMKSNQNLMPSAFDYKKQMNVPAIPVPGVYKFV